MSTPTKDAAIASLKSQLSPNKIFYYKVRKVSNGWACQYWYYDQDNMYNINWELSGFLQCKRLKDGCITGDPDIIIGLLSTATGLKLRGFSLY